MNDDLGRTTGLRDRLEAQELEELESR